MGLQQLVKRERLWRNARSVIFLRGGLPHVVADSRFVSRERLNVSG
jgi:hypothetical protein